MVYPSDRTFEVIFDEGEGLLAGIKCKEEIKEGSQYTIIIDGGNADYITSIEIGQRLDKLGIRYMDVGFSGGPAEAEKASLAAFVGGDILVHHYYNFALLESFLIFCFTIALIV
jgi:3-hydroxyisobutyrate dehydrogenase-like beta-hydroxyacid dehydrogenase